MERSRSTITAEGLGLATISYDSVDILREFAERRGITFPMLSDSHSVIIRQFGLLNEQVAPGSRDDGVPHPGIFLVNASGVILERFFEEHYWNRLTMGAVLSRLGREMAMAPVSVDREHLQVLVSASDAAVHPGNRFTLFVDVIPLAGAHVYGPEVGGGYQGLAVQIEPLPYLTVHAPRYPEASALNLAWTDEALTGYKGRVRVAIDVSLGTRQEMAAVRDAGHGLAIGGTVRLQACDDRICWAPEAIPVTWHVDLRAPDLERSPESLQHRPKA